MQGVGQLRRLRKETERIQHRIREAFRYGIAQSKRRSSYGAWLESHLMQFDVLSVTDETAVAYAAPRVALRRSGRPIPANHAWIAALALQHRPPLLSRDEPFDVAEKLFGHELLALLRRRGLLSQERIDLLSSICCRRGDEAASPSTTACM